MRSALPIDFSLAHQTQVGFVHERGRLECVVPAVTTKVACRAPPEFLVDERQQLLLRVRIPSRPRFEQTGHDSR